MDIFGSKFRLAYIETIAVATSCVQRVYLYRVQKIGLEVTAQIRSISRI